MLPRASLHSSLKNYVRVTIEIIGKRNCGKGSIYICDLPRYLRDKIAHFSMLDGTMYFNAVKLFQTKVYSSITNLNIWRMPFNCRIFLQIFRIKNVLSAFVFLTNFRDRNIPLDDISSDDNWQMDLFVSTIFVSAKIRVI